MGSAWVWLDGRAGHILAVQSERVTVGLHGETWLSVKHFSSINTIMLVREHQPNTDMEFHCLYC